MHSGNVVEVPEAVQQIWADFRVGTEVLGAQLESYWDTRQFAFWDDAQHGVNTQRARTLFERVQQEIDHGRAAIVWGLVVPEYGIVNGYTDDTYVVSTFRSVIGQPDDPVRYDQLEAKGGLEAIFVRDARPPRTEADDQEALTRALRMAEGSPYTFAFETPGHPLGAHQRYITGLAAYDAWAAVLEHYAPHTIYEEYLDYMSACVYETKHVAADFLRRVATRYPNRPFTTALQHAADAYTRAAREFEQLVWVFPFGEYTGLTAERCARGAAHIRAAQPHEQRAIEHLHEVQQLWT
jgi:hypothetical protein